MLTAEEIGYGLCGNCWAECDEWEPMPGEDSSSMETSKDHHSAGQQGWLSKHSCPLHLGIWVAKESATQTSTGWGSAFTHINRQSMISSTSVCLWQHMHGHWPTCSPLVHLQKDPHSSTFKYWEPGACLRATDIHEQRNIYYTWNSKRYSLTRY